MFLHLSVILFTGEGGSLTEYHLDRDTPLDSDSPWTDTLPEQRRTVGILLEYILVCELGLHTINSR